LTNQPQNRIKVIKNITVKKGVIKAIVADMQLVPRPISLEQIGETLVEMPIVLKQINQIIDQEIVTILRQEAQIKAVMRHRIISQSTRATVIILLMVIIMDMGIMGIITATTIEFTIIDIIIFIEMDIFTRTVMADIAGYFLQ
jgi:hypothetical protein